MESIGTNDSSNSCSESDPMSSSPFGSEECLSHTDSPSHVNSSLPALVVTDSQPEALTPALVDQAAALVSRFEISTPEALPPEVPLPPVHATWIRTALHC